MKYSCLVKRLAYKAGLYIITSLIWPPLSAYKTGAAPVSVHCGGRAPAGPVYMGGSPVGVCSDTSAPAICRPTGLAVNR